jgi:hypothetical protein
MIECHNCPGGASPSGARSGTYVFGWNSTTSVDDWAYQEVDLTNWAADIDAGNASIDAGGYLVCGECQANYDRYRLYVNLYDADGSLIETSYDSGTVLEECSWTYEGVTDYNLPADTRYLRIYFQAIEPGWPAGKADDFSVKIRVSSTQFHPADTNQDGCIDAGEIGDFIDRWYASSQDVSMVQLVRALEKWKLGC